MGHMMNSLILGAVFAFAVWRLRLNALSLMVLGMMYGAAIFAMMWWGILPGIDPAMKIVSGPGFFVTHLIFGMMLGLGIGVAQDFVGRAATHEPPAEARRRRPTHGSATRPATAVALPPPPRIHLTSPTTHEG
jgi:hypothetical protein